MLDSILSHWISSSTLLHPVFSLSHLCPPALRINVSDHEINDLIDYGNDPDEITCALNMGKKI
jgi:hypothetical protein